MYSVSCSILYLTFLCHILPIVFIFFFLPISATVHALRRLFIQFPPTLPSLVIDLVHQAAAVPLDAASSYDLSLLHFLSLSLSFFFSFLSFLFSTSFFFLVNPISVVDFGYYCPQKRYFCDLLLRFFFRPIL